ncbi:DgyrCDS6405 [Dimorphilus gyrociliatus]|uniref:DgyrCDS6405 n=1 Tax=Dimorphilus gyrociliatus TaxID=2664684 RepID=A0A7I8VQR7_9ANNE|nr:DgyrCDS6405 [Dimorphilus gyrociliatus]
MGILNSTPKHDTSGLEWFDESALLNQENSKGCCRGFFDKGREIESVNTSHSYTPQEKQKLASFDSFDYLPPDNSVYRSWAQSYFKKYEIDRWLISALIGICVGICGFFLHQLIDVLSYIKWHTAGKYIQEGNFGLAYLTLFGIGALLVLLSSSLILWRPSAAGSGMPELIGFLNGTQLRHIFNLRTGIVKFLSCCFAVASGLPVGPEGPMIHLGALIGAGISQMKTRTLRLNLPFFKRFRNSEDKRNFISAGAAAGVATAFRAPIGGLLFSLEEVSSFWSMSLMWQIFFCSMLATFTTDLLDSAFKRFNYVGSFGQFKSRDDILFEVSTKVSMNVIAFLPAILLGCICGILGAFFTFVNLKIRRLRICIRNNLKPRLIQILFDVVEPLFILLIITTASTFIPLRIPCTKIDCKEGYASFCGNESTRDESAKNAMSVCHNQTNSYSDISTILWGPGEDNIKRLFTRRSAEEISGTSLLLWLPLYFFFATWTAGSSVSSGLVVPMLFIGGLLGRLTGIVLGLIVGNSHTDWVDAGAWSLIGAAAFFAGVSRLTVSLTVIMLEITNDVTMLLPIMFAVITARSTGNLLTHSLYHAILELKCIPFLDEDPPSSRLVEPRIEEIMSKPAICICKGDNVLSWMKILRETNHGVFPVIETSNNDDVALLDDDSNISYEEVR